VCQVGFKGKIELKLKNLLPFVFLTLTLLISSIGLLNPLLVIGKETTQVLQVSSTSTQYTSPGKSGVGTDAVLPIQYGGDLDNEATTTMTKIVTQTETIGMAVYLGQDYIFVGGQNGTWFTKSQFPRLLQISLATNSTYWLEPVSGSGSVWGGGYNGSEWLISGWGSNDDPGSPNPFLYLNNGTTVLPELASVTSEAEWRGGDIFAASSNGTSWLVSGMGSGILNPKQSVGRRPLATNHFSVGLFDGRTFTDLSAELPMQMDGILYANAYNGNSWLVGGGYLSVGVLFSFNGKTFSSLTQEIRTAVPSFHSVQSIAWNGKYWLIGGLGFLAEYDGSRFYDLTSKLMSVLPEKVVASKVFSVNSIAWNGSSWLLGGGAPVAINYPSSFAWLVALNPSFIFRNLTYEMPVSETATTSSSILSITYSPADKLWIVGGYSNGHGMLLEYGKNVRDLSSQIYDMSYVNWVAAPG
jgi:hypothetical protein